MAASPARVLATLVDVEHWPEWTASVTSVQRLDEGPLAVGSKARVVQPKLQTAVWEVTEVGDDHFTWVSRRPGLVTTGRHIVEQQGQGTSVTLEIEHTGPLAGVAGALTKRLAQRYLEMEGAGLQRFCQA